MRTYVLVSFWMMAALFILRCFAVAVSSWPHERKHTIGEAVAGCLLTLAFILWSGWLLYGSAPEKPGWDYVSTSARSGYEAAKADLPWETYSNALHRVWTDSK